MELPWLWSFEKNDIHTSGFKQKYSKLCKALFVIGIGERASLTG
jgi:hypothetical protein